MSNFGRKAAIAAVAFATVGSTLFGGAALASDKKDGKDGKDGKPSVSDLQDATAVGGSAVACENSILSGAAVAVLGDATGGCNATGGDAFATNILGL